MPSFSMLGVIDPLAMMPPRPPAPGAVEVTAPLPGSCAVCTVPGLNPVSYGVSGTVLKLNVHSRRPADRLGVAERQLLDRAARSGTTAGS